MFGLLMAYQDTLQRVCDESLELSISVCNTELEQYTLAKLIDVFSQIIPTGFVLNTGYWPRFQTTRKQSLCVCGRFGLECRHAKSQMHFLWLQPLPNDDNFLVFYPKTRPMVLVKNETRVTPISQKFVGYEFSMELHFKRIQIRGPVGSKRREDMALYGANNFELAYISGQFIMKTEYYQALYTVMFTPSPFSIPSYSSIIPKLARFKTLICQNQQDLHYTISGDQMPKVTFVLANLNLPSHDRLPGIITATLLFVKDEQVQTEPEKEDDELVEIVKGLRSMDKNTEFPDLGPILDEGLLDMPPPPPPLVEVHQKKVGKRRRSKKTKHQVTAPVAPLVRSGKPFSFQDNPEFLRFQALFGEEGKKKASEELSVAEGLLPDDEKDADKDEFDV